MAGLYIDTSALGRLLLAEPDAAAIRAVMGRYDAWWSSEIVIVELRRLAARENLDAAAAVELRSRGAISAVMTFDGQLQAGCAHHALSVEAPMP